MQFLYASAVETRVLRARVVREKREKTKVEAVALATDPRGDKDGVQCQEIY
jgi:hypothetical protein